jgi:lipopolysaccharide export system protein LptC
MVRQKSAGEAVVQELGPAPPRHARVGWAAGKRVSAAEVQRYSRFVIIMKRALPLAALALLSVVVAYSLVPRQPDQAKLAITFRQLGILNNDLAMIDPRLTGVDSDGNPFVVTAAKAVQYAHNPNRAVLQNVEADLTLKDGTWLNTTAPRGLLDIQHPKNVHCAKTKCPADQMLDMSGPVAMYSDNGYEAHTTFAHIDMGKGFVRGNRYIRGQGPLGTFSADKFVFTFGGRQAGLRGDHKTKLAKTATAEKKLFLYGNVHMTIFKSSSHKSGSRKS